MRTTKFTNFHRPYSVFTDFQGLEFFFLFSPNFQRPSEPSFFSLPFWYFLFCTSLLSKMKDLPAYTLHGGQGTRGSKSGGHRALVVRTHLQAVVFVVHNHPENQGPGLRVDHEATTQTHIFWQVQKDVTCKKKALLLANHEYKRNQG